MENKSVKFDRAYKLCPKCNFFCHLSEHDQYCSLCGTQLIDKCPACSASISNPYAKFCKECGTAYPGKIQINKQSF
ncbi:MAG: hypothetical protein GW789_09870 [Ignavibacteria bacterium]|nr:hypothetical protein [Ignavibacteria bacterium]